jgi:hypothetical protein
MIPTSVNRSEFGGWLFSAKKTFTGAPGAALQPIGQTAASSRRSALASINIICARSIG